MVKGQVQLWGGSVHSWKCKIRKSWGYTAGLRWCHITGSFVKTEFQSCLQRMIRRCSGSCTASWKSPLTFDIEYHRFTALGLPNIAGLTEVVSRMFLSEKEFEGCSPSRGGLPASQHDILMKKMVHNWWGASLGLTLKFYHVPHHSWDSGHFENDQWEGHWNWGRKRISWNWCHFLKLNISSF